MPQTQFPEITIYSHGYPMVAKLYTPTTSLADKMPAILLIHGYGSKRQRYSRLAHNLMTRGFAALTFSARGHGDSDGDLAHLTLADHYDDVMAAFDWLASQPQVDHQRIAVFGSSLGGYLGAILTADRSIKALAMSAPAIYPDDEWEKPIGNSAANRLIKFREKTNLSSLKPVRALNKFTGHLLIMPHQLDEIMPTQITDTLAAHTQCAASLQIKLIKNAHHSLDHHSANQRNQIVIEWLTKII